MGRVRRWKVQKGPDGPCNTYVIVQFPKNPGSIASRRLACVLEKSFEATNDAGDNKEAKKGLYLVFADLVKLFRR